MAGYSDMPFRLLCRNMGSALSITEFVSTEAIFRNSKKTIDMLRYNDNERPVVFQVFGSRPDVIVESCKKILELSPNGIDLNLGCSVKKVASKGAGSALLKNPELVKKIAKAMVKNLPVPVSAKIRLGWDSQNKNYIEIGKILEGEGFWAVAVHGRTAKMTYTQPADWEPIGELKSKLEIKVFGNGDIKSYEEAQEKMKKYNLDGIYIGRAAMGNPWIFSGQKIENLSFTERLPTIVEHMKLMDIFYGKPYGIINFRKHLLKYLKGIQFSKKMKNEIIEITNIEDLKEALLNFNNLLENG